jgi:hypothetical protein
MIYNITYLWEFKGSMGRLKLHTTSNHLLQRFQVSIFPYVHGILISDFTLHIAMFSLLPKALLPTQSLNALIIRKI